MTMARLNGINQIRVIVLLVSLIGLNFALYMPVRVLEVCGWPSTLPVSTPTPTGTITSPMVTPIPALTAPSLGTDKGIIQRSLMILVALLVFSLIANVILLFLLLQRPTGVNNQHSIVDVAFDPLYWQQLVSGKDALGNLVKFLYWYRKGKATARDAQIVINILLQELERVWGLKQVGQIGEVVSFDPSIHVSYRGEHLSSGERVQIVDPGWQIGDQGQIIKYPIVKRVG